MRPRAYSWPDGHWDWYRHLAFKHGVRCERFIHVGGQVDKTSRGDPLHPDDLPTQIGVVVRHIDTVLREFGVTLADTVKLTAFYAADDDAVDEAWFVEVVAEACRANGLAAPRSGPVLVPVPLPWLALPGMRVEIEAVAMRGEYGQFLERDSASPAGVPDLPAPFNHALRCGGHVFVGGQDAAGSDTEIGARGNGGASAGAPRQGLAGGEGEAGAGRGNAASTGAPKTGALAHERLADALRRLGAGSADLVRLGAWYAAETPLPVRTADFERHVAPLECAYVELPAPRLAPEHVVRLDGWAVCGEAQGEDARSVLRLASPWRRPGRSAHVGGVRCGDVVFLSSQLPLDEHGAVVHPGDLNAQTRLCIERTRELLETAGLGLDHMMKQTSYFFGDADPKDIVTNQTLRSSFYREPAGASTGVPLADFGEPGVLTAIDTIAMA
ncbi:MAG: RidA family protein [Chromatiales bacterium]|nr:RidA family protein [Chromatiales bacterium]